MNKNLIKRTKPWLAACLLGLGGLGLSNQAANAQASAYQFAQSTGAYAPIVGGTLVDSAYYASTANTMDTKGWDLTIPFPFLFNGVPQTIIRANSNGGAAFGVTTDNGSAMISSTSSYSGAIAAMNRDLWGIFASQGTVTSGSNTITGVTDFTGLAVGTTMANTTGITTGTTVTAFDVVAGTITMSANATATSTNGTIRWGTGKVITTTLGTAPNRKFVIEWRNFGDYATAANARSLINFQIILNETTNKIDVVYGPCSQFVTTARTYQVGLRGATNSDYNNRTATTSWATTTAGTSNSANITRTDAINPASGLTFSWTPPTCIPPSAVTVSAITTTGATVSWTASSSAPANGYDYYYSTTNTAPTASTTPSGASAAGVTTANLSSLTPATPYYVWVRSKCSASDISNWTLTSSFTTLCNTFTVPFTESFSAGSLPSCWANTNNINSTSAMLLWKFSGAMDYGTTGNGGKTAGTFAWVDASTPYGLGDSVIMVSPPINLTGLTTPFVEFEWFKNHLNAANGSYPAGYTNNRFSVDIKSGSGSWTTIYTDSTNNAAWTTVGIALPATYVNATVQLRFVVNKNTGNGYFYDNVALDEIKVMEAPLCAAPTAPMVTGTTINSGSIAWTAPATAPVNGYEYYHSTSSVAPTAATVATGTSATASATIGTLAANTKYYYWVRSACAAPNKSIWTAIDSFYTGHCLPNGLTTSTSYYISSASTTGALTDISHTATAGVPYIDNTATSLISYPGNSFGYNMAASSGTNYFYIWIDWNNDLDFADAGETVLATTSYAASTTGTMTIPAATPLGSYRMRIANSWSGSITACGPAPYGNYIDYTLVVGAAPTCVPPTAPVATATSAYDANVSWTASTTVPANGYEYYYSTTNTAPTTATVASGATAAGVTNATLSTLTPTTTYFVWIRSVCSSTDKSAWSTVASFTTMCAPYTTPFIEEFTGTTFQPACWSQAFGLLAAPTVFDPLTSQWSRQEFGNASIFPVVNGSARINIYGTGRKGWLISPTIDLGTTPKYLEFDLALTEYYSAIAGALGAGQKFAVVVSTDNGVTWSSANTIRQWTDTSAISNTGTPVSLNLGAYSGLVKIGFYGESITSSEDVDVFVDNVEIVNPPCAMPVVALGADTSICAGTTLTLNAGTSNPNATYVWANSTNTTPTLDVTATGTYSVTVTDGACATSDTIVVSVVALPVVDLGPDSANCAGGPIVLNAGGAASDTYVWSDNSTLATLSATTSGTYYVTVTNATGCVATDTVELVIGLPPTIGGITTTGTSPNFNFTAENPMNVTTYNWNFGDNTPESAVQNPSHLYIPGATDQTYTVSLIVSNECGSDTVETSVIVRATSLKGLNLNADALKLYPNPTAHNVVLENTSNFKMKQIVITNILGQQVAVVPVTGNKQTIDVSNLTSGLYHVKVEFEEGVVTRKLEVLK